MSWIARGLEERLAAAARDGELEPAAPLKGKPIADLGRQRDQGWWANQFVERELSHDRREAAEATAARARAGFWRASTVEQLRDEVAAANVAIAAANVNLVPTDQLAPFDPDDIAERWRRLTT